MNHYENPENSSKAARDVLTEIYKDPDTNPLYRYAVGKTMRDDLSIDDWTKPLKDSSGTLCLKFPSGDGGHYVRYRVNCGLKAIYAGPNGPEIRPSDLDYENLHRLIRLSDWIDVLIYSETPFSNIEIAGDA